MTSFHAEICCHLVSVQAASIQRNIFFCIIVVLTVANFNNKDIPVWSSSELLCDKVIMMELYTGATI